MSGLKQFYMKNIKIFTILLVLLAGFVAWKCISKYQAAQQLKKQAAAGAGGKMPQGAGEKIPQGAEAGAQSDIEKYRYGAEITELAFTQFDKPSVTSGLYDTPLSRADFATYGSYSKDPLANIIRNDIPNLGYSGQQEQSVSKMKIPLLYTAYGGDDYSMY